MTLQERFDRLKRALDGIASCATRCGCCELHVQVARKALADVSPTPILEEDEIPGVRCVGCND